MEELPMQLNQYYNDEHTYNQEQYIANIKNYEVNKLEYIFLKFAKQHKVGV